MFHINATSSLSFQSNKKACSQPRKQAIILQATLEEHRFFGNPAILSEKMHLQKGPVALCPLVPQSLPFRKLYSFIPSKNDLLKYLLNIA
jgi:hypothetical protein